MFRSMLAVLLFALSTAAFAQPYTPLQKGHVGVWGDPDHVGEGLMPAPKMIDGEPFVFAAMYLIDGGESLSYFAQGPTHDVCERSLCVLDIYRRAAVNGDAFAVGALVLETPVSHQSVRWDVLIEDGERTIVRSGVLKQLLDPAGAPIGGCDLVGGFSPSRPHAGTWCE